MISANKLYDPLFDGAKEKGSEAVNWMAGYQNDNSKVILNQFSQI